jgi:ABC-type transport system involved in cytochrome bd biosynthesis fused ATPase/permease subunit
VYCSNRGLRGGCGRTFAFFLADILPRHTLTASLVWPWLVKLLAGLSLKAAAEKLRLPFALETVCRLRRRLRQGLDQVRTRLCLEQSPPASAHADPLLQTVEHLRRVFSGGGCPPADFQLHFQHPFLG